MKKTDEQSEPRVFIWDFPTRLFHWALVAAITWSWISIEILGDLQQHFRAGYCVITLLIFRFFWGFLGSFYARFKRLFFKPAEIAAYLKAFASPNSKKYPGHNPLGSLAVIVMLLMLVAQVSTGLFSSDDYFYGPLAGLVETSTVDQLTGLHHRNFSILQFVIGGHVLAILLYRLVKKERLTSAMIHGYKNKESLTEPVQPATSAKALNKPSNKLWHAIIVLLISITIVYVLVNHVAEPVELSESYF